MTISNLNISKFSKQNYYVPMILCVVIMGLQSRVDAHQPIKILLQASNISTTQTISLEDRVMHLEERIQESRENEDFLDRLNIFFSSIAGVVIAGIGIVAANAYKKREIKISQIQTVQGLMPYLQSENHREVRRALRLISILGDEELSIALTLEYPEEISIPALAKMASSTNPTSAMQGEKTLEDFFQRTYPSLSTIRKMFLKLGSEYQIIRETSPASSERTSKMESTLKGMKNIAQAIKETTYPVSPELQEFTTALPLLQEFTNKTSMGAQLVAIAILQVQPNINFLDWLARKVAADPGSFHGYHAAVALRKAAEVFGEEHREVIQEAIDLARSLAREATKDSDAFGVLNEAQRGLP